MPALPVSVRGAGANELPERASQSGVPGRRGAEGEGGEGLARVRPVGPAAG